MKFVASSGRYCTGNEQERSGRPPNSSRISGSIAEAQPTSRLREIRHRPLVEPDGEPAGRSVTVRRLAVSRSSP